MTSTLLEPASVVDWTHPQLVDPFDVIDLFAAGGGWDEGARAVPAVEHDKILGFEWDLAACQTAIAAGHRRFIGDIATLKPGDFARTAIRGIIASPPCQGFSLAGDGAGRRDTELILEAVRRIEERPHDVDHIIADLAAQAEDDKSALVLEPLRWVLDLRPEWTCWEQVPAVKPLWKACARVLRKAGYHVWTGTLNAADYGVPQTRKRTILIASRVRHVDRPEPTHARGGDDGDLFSEPRPPWVSMATALGWGMTTRPYVTVSAGTEAGGQDTLMAGGSAAREVIFGSRESEEWVEQPADHPLRGSGRIRQVSNYYDGDRVNADGDRVLADRDPEVDPSVTMTGRPPSWMAADPSEVVLRDNQPNGTERSADQPAQTIAFGNNAAQWRWRLAGDAEVVYVNGTGENAARRPADQPAPTIMFGERLNTVEWQLEGIDVQEDPDLPPDVLEFRDRTTGEVLRRLELAPDGMKSAGIDAEGRFRPATEPAPTITGARNAVWADRPQPESLSELAVSGALPEDYSVHTGTNSFLVGPGAEREQAIAEGRWREVSEPYTRGMDEPSPTITSQTSGWKVRSLEEGEARTEIRRSGDRIEEGFDPAVEPAATVTSRVDRWQTVELCEVHSIARCTICLPAQTPCDCEMVGAVVGHYSTAHRTSCEYFAMQAGDSEVLVNAEGMPVPLNDQTQAGFDGSWSLERPATTLAGRDLVGNPGSNANRFNNATKSRNDGVRVTVAEASILQSFPPDYPWQGAKTQQYQQVGNAVPPRLAAHVLAETVGTTPPEYS